MRANPGYISSALYNLSDPSLDMGGGSARHPGHLHRELSGPCGGADHQSVLPGQSTISNIKY